MFRARTRSNTTCIGITVGKQRAYFELKYFKIVKMRDAKYSLKMAAEKWRQIFPFLNALYHGGNTNFAVFAGDRDGTA